MIWKLEIIKRFSLFLNVSASELSSGFIVKGSNEMFASGKTAKIPLTARYLLKLPEDFQSATLGACI